MSGRKRRRFFMDLNSSGSWSPSDTQLPASRRRGPKAKRTKTPAQPKRVSAKKTTAASASASQALASRPIGEGVDSQIVNFVTTKVTSYFKSNGFISSDEDDVQIVNNKAKNQKSTIFTKDDSALDGPSSSTASCTSLSKSPSVVKANTPADDDIMGFVDEILAKGDDEEVESNDPCDMENLESYRKETEDMLKDAAKLLEEFKGPKKEEKPVSVPENTMDCAICLEPLKSRPTSATQCGHIFCTDCIKQACVTLKQCPTCRTKLTLKKIFPVYL